MIPIRLKKIVSSSQKRKRIRRELAIERLECRLPFASINLGDLYATPGATFHGIDSFDESGGSARSAGDVNGDGFDDIIVGASNADGRDNAKADSGESYLVFGRKEFSGATQPVSFGELDGTTGVTIYGAESGDRSGQSVSGAGDVNNDGYADVLIGAPYARIAGTTENPGMAYLVYGSPNLPKFIDLGLLNSAGMPSGIVFRGDKFGDETGWAVASAGDVNNDGFADIAIGAPKSSVRIGYANAQRSGKTYVVFGDSHLPSTVALADVGTPTGALGFTITSAGLYSGFDLAAGDFNGDGYSDLLICARDASNSLISFFVVFGQSRFPARIERSELGTAEGFPGLKLQSTIIFYGSVQNAGDVNGDTFDDILVRASHEAYLVFGGKSLPSSIDLNKVGEVDGNDGILIKASSSANSDEEAGQVTSIGSAGDFNQDGFDDFVVVQAGVGSRAVQSHVVFGGAVLPKKFDFSKSGFQTSTFVSPFSVSDFGLTANRVGDVNKDGYSDLLIAAPSASIPPGERRLKDGVCYVVLGSDRSPELVSLKKLGDASTFQTSMFYNVRNTTYSHQSAAGLGDVNGDGYDDLGLTDSLSPGESLRQRISRVYVTFGQPESPKLIDPAIRSGMGVPRRIEIRSVVDFELSNRVALSGLGDIDADGFADIGIGFIVSTTSNTHSFGVAYVLFGSSSLPELINLGDLGTDKGPRSIAMSGFEAFDSFGFSLSTAGDVNGDGFDDIVVGAPTSHYDDPIRSASGEAYLIFGSRSLPPSFRIADLNKPGKPSGTAIRGRYRIGSTGYAVAGGGDFNGDGFDDIVISEPFSNSVSYLDADKPKLGTVYVLLGGETLPETIDLADDKMLADGEIIQIRGSGAKSGLGHSVSLAGDVNRDGFDDLLVGAVKTYSEREAGKVQDFAYLIYGGSAPLKTIDLAVPETIDGKIATVFSNPVAESFTGKSVSGVGDVNADGFDDFLIGASNDNHTDSITYASKGAAYFIFGARETSARVDLSNLESRGHKFFTEQWNDSLGTLVGAAGDFDGDGLSDMLLHAPGAKNPFYGWERAGETHFIPGSGFSFGIGWFGSSGDDSIVGTTSTNSLVGARGNDRIAAQAGEVVIVGGQGDDTMEIQNMRFARVDGGTGYDTLRIGGSNVSLKLGDIPSNRIRGIERFELVGSGKNRVTLSARDVLRLSGSNNTLTVDGSPGLELDLEGPWRFASVATEKVGSSLYRVLVHGQARLKVGEFWNSRFGLRQTRDSYEVPANWILRAEDQSGALTDSRLDNGLLANDSDLGGLPLTGVLVVTPQYGTVDLRENGTFVYKPRNPSTFNTKETFSYRLRNSLGSYDETTLVEIALIAPILSPKQNFRNRFDVDNDGQVTPVDVLVVINTLKRFGVGREIRDFAGETTPYIDVDGDLSVAPIDVLQVINRLNRRTVGEGVAASRIGPGMFNTVNQLIYGNSWLLPENSVAASPVEFDLVRPCAGVGETRINLLTSSTKKIIEEKTWLRRPTTHSSDSLRQDLQPPSIIDSYFSVYSAEDSQF